MPHLTIELSSNLESRIACDSLLSEAHQALLMSGVFDGPDIKSRVVRLSEFQIGTSADVDEGFVHVRLDLLAGRSEDTGRQLSQTLVRALVGVLPNGLGFPVQVSCDVREMNRDSYSKAIHTK